MTDEQTLNMYSGHPMGLFSFFKECANSCGDQWNDDPKLLKTG